MNTQPKFKSQKAIRRDMRTSFKMKIAAKKIQSAWRIYFQKLQAEQEDYTRSYGCDCGDWLCTGYLCSEERYIPCCMCGDNCADGDYESWRFCTRSCMVRASRD
jgi:hypothetical protein